MQLKDYLKYALNNDLYITTVWAHLFFGILLKDFKDSRYLKIVNNQLVVKLLDSEEILEVNPAEYLGIKPLFTFKEPIDIDPSWTILVKDKVTTTIGRLYINKLLLEYNFRDKIPYRNTSKELEIKAIEKDIGNMLREGTVKVSEYLSFTNAVSLLGTLTRLASVSSTEKNTLPPPGIEAKKKQLHKEFDEKYGPKWINDRSMVVKFQDELKKYDDEWLQGDPSLGKLVSGKVKNNARVKMYLTFGGEVGFERKSSKVKFVENSLLEQYPETKEELAAMFNSSRAGSYDRGVETQKGGAGAKEILRASGNIKISNTDCGTKVGWKTKVDAVLAKNLVGRYLVDGTKVENGELYLGKIIELRSPMFCQAKGSYICRKCAGDILAEAPTSITLRLLKISGTLLYIPMKSMHNTQVSMTKYNILDHLS